MSVHDQAKREAAAVAAAEAQHLTAAERIARAEARLARSREKLLRDDGAAGGEPASFNPGLSFFVRLGGRSIRRWWRRHPAVMAAQAASADVERHLRPLAQRYPLAVVGLAALAGGVLMWLSPRRLTLAVVPWIVHEVNVLVRTVILTFFTRP